MCVESPQSVEVKVEIGKDGICYVLNNIGNDTGCRRHFPHFFSIRTQFLDPLL